MLPTYPIEFPKVTAELAKAADPCPINYGVVKNTETCTVEAGHQTTVRLSFRGIRNIVLVPLMKWIGFLSKSNDPSKLDPKSVYKAFRNASPEVRQGFVADSRPNCL